MSNSVLSVRGLVKTLRSSAHRFDLRIEELELMTGRFYGLVGKSGSGKSTTLDILAMVSAPTEVTRFVLSTPSGEVDVADLIRRNDDKRISRIRLNHFGYILQTGGLFEFLNVRQNLELPMRLSGRAPRPDDIKALASTFEIDGHLAKPPSALSGGQRQRVSILRALSLSPLLVLADEPTASVDETMADAIVQQLKDLAAVRGSTVLMVSHDLELIDAVADEVFVLRPRAVSEDWTVSELQAGEAL